MSKLAFESKLSEPSSVLEENSNKFVFNDYTSTSTSSLFPTGVRKAIFFRRDLLIHKEACPSDI